jgi:hypothetical protein
LADLGPAWIGLTGVAVGAIVTQGADALRWAAERARLKRERRQTLLLQLLRHAGDIVVLAQGVGGLVESGANEIDLDYRPLDEAGLRLGQTVDEIRVIGPRDIREEALEFFERAMDVQAAAERRETGVSLRQYVDELYLAKVDLLAKAAGLGLVDD